MKEIPHGIILSSISTALTFGESVKRKHFLKDMVFRSGLGQAEVVQLNRAIDTQVTDTIIEEVLRAARLSRWVYDIVDTLEPTAVLTLCKNEAKCCRAVDEAAFHECVKALRGIEKRYPVGTNQLLPRYVESVEQLLAGVIKTHNDVAEWNKRHREQFPMMAFPHSGYFVMVITKAGVILFGDATQANR